METTQQKNKVTIHIYDIVVISRICKKLQVNFLRDKLQDKTWSKALNRNFISENTQTARAYTFDQKQQQLRKCKFKQDQDH